LISQDTYEQLLTLAEDLNALPTSDQQDIWTYSWGSPMFSPTKAYKHLIGTRQVHPCFKWLWKSSAQKKHKVFFWLLLKDRLSTRNILKRKNRVLPSYDCVLCQLQLEETLEHLFLHCPFAFSYWNLLHLHIAQGGPFEILHSFRVQLNKAFFMDIIILMSWCIWMSRNDLIFKACSLTFNLFVKDSKQNLL
jgi:hypothetical protein